MGILGSYANRYLLLSSGREGKEGTGNSGCCAVVRGTTILKTVVLLIASGSTPTTTTTTSVFASSVVVRRRALFCARVGVWECVERAEEESRLVPVILVTVSENQTELGSLVGVKAERLPKRKWEVESHQACTTT